MVLALGRLKADGFGRVENDGVREADVDGQLLAAVGLGAIAGAHQHQRLLEAFGYANHHVVDQAAVEAVHGLVGFGVAGAFKRQDIAFLLEGDIAVHRLGQSALGAFTVTVLSSSTVTVTPAGTVIGSFPIRDIVLHLHCVSVYQM